MKCSNGDNLDSLIREMQEKGILTLSSIKFKGKAGPVCNFLGLMANTVPFCKLPEMWALELDDKRN